MKNAYPVLPTKPERRKNGRKDTIKMYLKDIGYEGVE
jgi:hypothetical protein